MTPKNAVTPPGIDLPKSGTFLQGHPIYTKKKRKEEEKVTQLFLETNALHEIHNFIEYQKGNISKAVFITLFYFTAKDKHNSCPFFWTLKTTVSGPAFKAHFVMA